MLTSCSSFAYKYYGLSGADFSRGTLLGDKPENDLPFGRCEPNSTLKNPCVVLFAEEFFKLKLDFTDTQNKLKACEASKRTGS